MQGTCTESLHLILGLSGNAVNRKNTKTIGKYREFFDSFLIFTASIIIIIFCFFWAHQHKAAGLKIKLSKIKWLQQRLIR